MSDEQYKQLITRQLVMEFYLENLIASQLCQQNQADQAKALSSLLEQMKEHSGVENPANVKNLLDLASILPDMLRVAEIFSGKVAERANSFRANQERS